jgi:hypothetical protein
LDENSAEYVRNLSVKAAATIEKLQSQPSPETTDHPPATVTREREPKGSTVSLTDHVWSVQKPFFIKTHTDANITYSIIVSKPLIRYIVCYEKVFICHSHYYK